VSDAAQRWVAVAHILRPRGNKGEIAAQLLTDFPQRLTALQEAFVSDTGGREPQRVQVRACWLSQNHPEQAVFHFAGFASINDAEKLRGRDVLLPIEQRVALPAGYALARLSGGWGQTMGVGIFLTYLVPPTLLFLPLSRVISDLGLSNSLGSLILVYPSFTIPFSTWLLMGFFKTIPPELEDAALIDGCSRIQALVRIVFPISLPGILTVVIFSFSLVVNEFIYAITFISSSHNRTLSAGVPTDLIRGDLVLWGGVMAATLIPSIPLALLYNAFLNRFIAGFTGGAFR